MEELNQISQTLALTMGAAWGSGINLYATLLMLGYLAHTGSIDLPPDLMIVADPLVMTAAGLMYAVEFFADKVPGVDTVWDTLHTFIRIPAGAMLAAGAIGDIGPAAEIAAALVGGSLAGITHATKAGTRVLINTSPEPFTNWTASIMEDVAVFVGVWASIQHPTFFVVGMVVFILFMIWALPKLWRGIKRVFKFLGKLFGWSTDDEDFSKPLANDKLPGPD
ncbi:MAG TPA: DUF4126 domain-containing protein [Cycloclasticus sp.]|nr:DUF4126 domain-containing protein [Cycloclasticus sp.]HIL93094.1 DUF4126 domain-containing protein [Cycloclasticus sp.]